jgi:rubrerythrin
MTWVCKICGYTHKGTQPPEACPLCGVAASEFEPAE